MRRDHLILKKPWIGVGIPMVLYLGLQGGLAAFLRYLITLNGFSTWWYEASEHAVTVLAFLQFGIALLLLSFWRMSWPIRGIGCTLWAGLSSALWECSVYYRETDQVLWNVLFTVLSLWLGAGLFLIARWHFGMELAQETAPTPRRAMNSRSVLIEWGLIVAATIITALLLRRFRAVADQADSPVFASAMGFAIGHAFLIFPIFIALFARRWAWLWCLPTVLVYGAIAVFDLVETYSINPFDVEKHLINHAITAALVLCLGTWMRLFGFRWAPAAPWPVREKLAPATTPSPFD